MNNDPEIKKPKKHFINRKKRINDAKIIRSKFDNLQKQEKKMQKSEKNKTKLI